LKILRKFALALSLFVPAAGFAQTGPQTVTYEQILNQTFANMNLRPDVTFTVVGSERVGDRTVPFDTTVVWRRTGLGADRTLKMSVVKRVDGQTVHEVRANGKTLFSYDFKTRSYSATPYHQIKDTRNAEQRDEGYGSRMMTSLGRSVSSSGPDSYVARLVQEAMGDPAGQTQVMGVPAPLHYRSWMPGRAPVELAIGSAYPDPVVPETIRPRYVPDAANAYYLYNGSPRRAIVFHVDPRELGYEDDELRGIFFGESSVVGGRSRLLQWTMTVDYPIVDPANAATYENQFGPYTDMRGWRIVTNASAPRG
jgi:hypothetical protein